MELSGKTASERVKIVFFGLRNAGKSSLVNAFTNQDLSIVSDVAGTTTDAVRKTMEILPIGPCVVVDTPGIDDEGLLGQKRVERTLKEANSADIAVIVVDTNRIDNKENLSLIDLIKAKNIPYVIAFNKVDETRPQIKLSENEIFTSAVTGEGVEELRKMVASITKKTENQKNVVSDLVNEGDTVVLVIPIDDAAPKGRLILPQQMVLRELLEKNVIAICTKETNLGETLLKLKEKPNLVITDSQVFGKVSKILPEDVKLTSFSILFARYKGDLETLVSGAASIKNLKDGDTVLVSEGCTHHRQCGDIGSVKMPKWIKDFTGKNVNFEFTSGNTFPEDLSKYALVLHCGGCMLNEKEMKHRLSVAKGQNIPIVNYGVAISHMNGILKRSLEIFPDFKEKI